MNCWLVTMSMKRIEDSLEEPIAEFPERPVF